MHHYLRPFAAATSKPLAILGLVCCLASTPAGAQPAQSGARPPLTGLSVYGNVFVQALATGQASSPLPADGPWRAPVQMLQKKTGNDGPLEIRAIRLVRYSQQPQCGRVAFGVWQPATRMVFAGVGGELNICEDGRPPLQECPQRPGVLVPVGARCAGGTPARNTAEVAQAIERARELGGLTMDELRQRTQAERPPSMPKPSSPRARGATQ